MIAESALERGFATLAYSENPYVTHYFGLDQGFEVFDEAFPISLHLQRKELGADFDSASRLSGILDQAVAQDHRPFFLYIHILRPHNPYAPPRPYAGRFGSDPTRRGEGETQALIEMDLRGGRFDPDRISQLIALYDENLAYADALIGAFLAGLDTRGLRNRTIVVLTSDHGEAFGEHGRMLHSTQLFDPMLRIPLLVRVPGEPASVQSAPIQLADLGQGLLAYFLDSPDSASGLMRLGVGLAAPRLLYSWTNAKTHLVAVRTEQRKLVIDAETLEVVAYHDLDSDPEEQHPIPVDARAETLRRGLEAKIAKWVGVPLRIMTAHALDARKRRELEALGYLEPDLESGSRPGSPDVE